MMNRNWKQNKNISITAPFTPALHLLCSLYICRLMWFQREQLRKEKWKSRDRRAERETAWDDGQLHTSTQSFSQQRRKGKLTSSARSDTVQCSDCSGGRNSPLCLISNLQFWSHSHTRKESNIMHHILFQHSRKQILLVKNYVFASPNLWFCKHNRLQSLMFQAIERNVWGWKSKWSLFDIARL